MQSAYGRIRAAAAAKRKADAAKRKADAAKREAAAANASAPATVNASAPATADAAQAAGAAVRAPMPAGCAGAPAEVAAGVPDEAGEGCVALDAAAVLKARSRSFALKVRGCSMIGAGIEDGDIVVGEFTPTARVGAVVVALIDGQSTLKRLVSRGGHPCLVSENPNCPDPIPVCELVIQGVVHTVVKRIAMSC